MYSVKQIRKCWNSRKGEQYLFNLRLKEIIINNKLTVIGMMTI